MIKRPDSTDYQYKYLALDVKGMEIFKTQEVIADETECRSNKIISCEHRRSQRRQNGRLEDVWSKVAIVRPTGSAGVGG